MYDYLHAFDGRTSGYDLPFLDYTFVLFTCLFVGAELSKIPSLRNTVTLDGWHSFTCLHFRKGNWNEYPEKSCYWMERFLVRVGHLCAVRAGREP
jgi:hypothetical protein